MNDVPRYGFGDAMQASLDAALDDWRRSYASHVKKDELLAGPLATISVAANLMHGGRLNVTVCLYGRRRHQDQVYFTRYIRTSADCYEYVNGTLDL